MGITLNTRDLTNNSEILSRQHFRTFPVTWYFGSMKLNIGRWLMEAPSISTLRSVTLTVHHCSIKLIYPWEILRLRKPYLKTLLAKAWFKVKIFLGRRKVVGLIFNRQNLNLKK